MRHTSSPPASPTGILFRLLLFAVCVLGASGAWAQSLSSRTSVRLSATVDATVPSITVQWAPFAGATQYRIYRRPAGITFWAEQVAQLEGSAAQWTDLNVAVGQAYEYKVVRTANGMGTGYIRSGIALAPVEARGTLLLLVDSALGAQLGGAVNELQADLVGDGWWVRELRIGAAHTPAMVRGLVANEAANDPALKAVYILGNVPVPYSGDLAPDGHVEHRGAWACDAYYGEINGTWTDAVVNNTSGAYPRNHNVPGDGKLDQSDLPSPVDLWVGRVDLSRLPSFTQNELGLTQLYLEKAHRWKTRQFTVPTTAVIFDDLQWTNYPLAQSGHMGFAACVGSGNVLELSTGAPFAGHLLANAHLWTFCGSAGGQGTGSQGQITFNGMPNGATTQQVAQGNAGGVFNMSFGSYFGDWDNENNYLRALLGSGNSLVHIWSAIPNWYVYPMAMGEPIGHSMLRSVNNTFEDHGPQNAGWQGQAMDRIHMALMGDPTLRLTYIAPPTDLVATNTDWYASFSWSPSPEPVDGYLVHRIDTVTGTFTRVTPDVVSDTFFVSDELFVPGARYLVRAVKRVTSNRGSFHDLSLGAQATAQGVQVADCMGLIGGAAIPGTPCDDGDPLTENDVFNAQCDCVGTPVVGIEDAAAAAVRVRYDAQAELLWVERGTPGPGAWRLVGPSGALVRTGTVVDTLASIATGGLASGVYLFLLDAEDGRSAPVKHRFVVAH